VGVPKLDHQNRKIMASNKGNKKYPIPYTEHPQCDGCWMEEKIKEAKEVIFDNRCYILGVGKYSKK
jgi:hypothetical protein